MDEFIMKLWADFRQRCVRTKKCLDGTGHDLLRTGPALQAISLHGQLSSILEPRKRIRISSSKRSECGTMEQGCRGFDRPLEGHCQRCWSEVQGFDLHRSGYKSSRSDKNQQQNKPLCARPVLKLLAFTISETKQMYSRQWRRIRWQSFPWYT